jgi:hypothetical protein
VSSKSWSCPPKNYNYSHKLVSGVHQLEFLSRFPSFLDEKTSITKKIKNMPLFFHLSKPGNLKKPKLRMLDNKFWQQL